MHARSKPRSSTERSSPQVHSACDNCRRKKIKCSGQHPDCSRCKEKNITCVYEPSERRRKPRVPDEERVLRQASAAAASSQQISQALPKELQGVFSLDFSPVAPPRQQPHPPKAPTSSQADSRPVSRANAPTELEFEDLESQDGSDGMHGSMTTDDQFLDHNSVDWNFTPIDFDFDVDMHKPATDIDPSDDCFIMSSPKQCLGQPILSPSGRARSRRDSGFESASSQPNDKASTLIFESERMVLATAMSIDTSTPSRGCVTNGSCYREASELLDRLENRRYDCNDVWIDGLLSFQKANIAKCSQLLACGNCASLSGFVTLLLFIFDQVINSFQQVLDAPLADDNYFSSSTQSSTSSRAATPSTDKMRLINRPRLRVSFGEYECAMPEEWQSIAAVLICSQVKVLHVLLEQYKKIATTQGWQTQTTKILGLGERLGELQTKALQLRRD